MTTNDGPEDHQAESRVGSVADEAARLVEVLAAFGGGARHGGQDAPEGRADAGRGPSRRSDPEDDGAGNDDAVDPGTCTCGGRRPAACAVCPVCQLIAFVQRVSPDTVDRLADVVELAATGLRDLAVVQRSRRERAEPDATAERGGAEPQPGPDAQDDPAPPEVPDPPDGPDGP
ncbi:MAG TPA: hypothetical protein VFM07_06885 [Intrasporangium sp.]|nr:hypothetical protein [Intrasporangium sp.]